MCPSSPAFDSDEKFKGKKILDCFGANQSATIWSLEDEACVSDEGGKPAVSQIRKISLSTCMGTILLARHPR